MLNDFQRKPVILTLFHILMNSSSTLRSEFHVKSFSNRSFIIAIKSVLFFFLMFTTVQLHAQESSQYTMYQNSYSTFNPGATGLYNKYFASFTTRFPVSDAMFYRNAESLVYEQKVDKINSGFGANITYENMQDFRFDWIVALNYAYHFDLKDAGKLGAGISVGNILRRFDFQRISYPNMDTTSSRLFMNFGLVYSFKNLNLGFSIAEVYLKNDSKERLSMFGSMQPAYSFFGAYDIKLNSSLALTPAIYAVFYEEGNRKIDYKITLKVQDRFWAGVSLYTDNINTYDDGLFSLMIGYDILGKYRIGYAQSVEFFGGLSRYGYHEISLAWMLK